MSSEEKAPEGEGRRMKPRIVLALVLAVGLVVGAAVGFCADKVGRGDGSSSSGTQPSPEADHEHDWSVVYELNEVPAETHVVHHGKEYGTETVYETVCNSCEAVITGKTAEHARETGHVDYSTDVPVVNEIVAREAYDETVVDKPAHVQLVHTSDRCASCGEIRDVEDEVVEEDPAVEN